MKNLFTFLVMILALNLGSQIPVTIDGEILNSDGLPIPNLIVTCSYDGSEFSDFLVATTDQDGYFEFEFESDFPDGCAYIEYPDCNFDFFSQDICWTIDETELSMSIIYCEGGSLDSLFCDVIVFEQYINSEQYLFTWASGLAPFDYQWSSGQNTPFIKLEDEGTYCVTVTSQAGCLTTNCYDFMFPSDCPLWIYEEPQFGETILYAESGGLPPYEFNWSNGEINPAITVTEEGEYCVTVVDGLGCTSTECYYATIDSSCWSYIYEDFAPNGDSELVIVAQGQMPFVYEWDNGSNDPTVPVTADQTLYCVTVTDAGGCVSENCYEVYGECGVFVSCDPVPEGVFLFADAWGSWPITYQWDTGETTESIEIFEEGTYCVTIVDADNCTSEECFYANPEDNPFDSTCWIIINAEYLDETTVELSTSNFGMMADEYFWSTGEMTESIIIEDEGEYCVDVFFNNGCVANACYYHIPFSPCGVEVSCDPDPMGGTTFIPYPWGQAPFTYEWSTGEITSEIYATEEGEYCVTVTDATGCTADWCGYFEPDIFMEPCLSFILLEYLSDSLAVLTAESLGVGPFEITWSTGEIDQNEIEVTESGFYCVTMVDANSCISEACVDVSFWDTTTGPSFSNAIVGLVLGDSTLMDGYVELYRWNDGEYEDVASMTFLNDVGIPYYHFTDLEPGSYLTKAFPSDDTFVPTYHQTSLIWEDANEIILEEGDVISADIFLIAKEETDGGGLISGTVTDGSGLWAGDDDVSRDGDPLEGINVLLLTDSNLPIANVQTDEDGEFRFGNLAFGRYKVMIEEAGKSHSERFVTLSPNVPAVEIGFELDDDLDFVSAVAEWESISDVFIVQNPVEDILNIQFNLKTASELRIEILDITARQQLSKRVDLSEAESNVELAVQHLNTGLYLVRISDGKAQQTLSMIKS